MKTSKNDIKSARYLSNCPPVYSVVYRQGGSDTYTPAQLERSLTPAAQSYVIALANQSANRSK